jgi:hypothetical protein
MIIQEIASQLGSFIVENPVTSISFAVSGATVALNALDYLLPNAKWDNRALRALKEVMAHVALDRKAKYIKIDFDDEIDKEK